MCEDLDGLGVAQHDQSTIGIAIANLPHSAWAGTWLA